MIRFAVLLFNMIGLLTYRMFFVGGVVVTQSVPSDMKPGTEYTVEITINKGTIGGFAKFQQDLPEGFTATAVESKGASFSFTGTAVKFIWTALPSEEEFKISYKVAVASNAPAGEKMLGGKFFYVVDNAKQSVELETANVTVTGDAAVATTNTNTQTTDNTNTQANNTNTQTTDNTNTQTNNTNTQTTDNTNTQTNNTNTQTTDNTNTQTNNTNTQTTDNTNTQTNNTNTQTTDNTNTQTNNTNTQTTDNTNTQTNNTNTQTNTNANTTVGKQEGNVACTRKITPNGANDYTVEMIIKKGNISGFAKLNENIPAGFTATAGNLNKGSFSFNEQKIKIVWVTLPLEPEFTVSYKISGSAPMANQIDGLLSYIENEETKKYVIDATAIGGAGTVANTNTNTQTTDNTNANTNTNTQTTDNTQANTNTNTQTTDNINTNTNTQTTDNTNTNTNTNTQTTDNTNTNTNTQVNDNTNTIVTPAAAKVNYRVQICALKMSRKENSFFENLYSFSKVDMEQHEGWIKYLVGGFLEYKSARDYREQTRSKGVVGPFVTAYNSGRRITVQEALMISSQQWYK